MSGLGPDPLELDPTLGLSLYLLFPQDPLHFHPCNSFRQEQSQVGDVTVGWQPHPSLDVLSSCWMWALLSSLLSVSTKVPSYESLESLNYQVFCAF